jgi:GNAT superfamily N-acetyltransferase
MVEIRLIPREEIYSIIPLLQILNQNMSETVLRDRLEEMISQGYECVGVFDEDKLIGISGLWVLTKYYIGRHIEPDNVVIHPNYRGKGIGEKLMNWIEEYAKSKNCIALELNCYTLNESAHKFWFKQGFEVLAYHFQKKLK